MNTQYKSPFIKRLEDEVDEPENKPESGNNQEPKSPLLLKKQEELFLEKRAIYLWGIVDDKSARDIVNKLLLLEADKPGEEIKFFINSPGGVVTSGMVIYDTIEMISSPVSTICMGLAASMGSILLSVGAKGRRFVFPHGEIMIHQPSGAIGGQASDIQITAREIRKIKNELDNIIAEHSGKDPAQIAKDRDRDFWMTAQEAKEYGLVDEVLISNPNKSKS